MSDEKKISFTVHEITNEEAAEGWRWVNSPQAQAARDATDEADSYFSGDGRVHNPTDSFGYTVLPVLEPLWGRPWNGATLNFLAALRPSEIRVTTGEVKSNCRLWRVTVYVGKDLRTIKCIEQEVKVEVRGFRNGHDARCFLGRGQFAPPAINVINMNAIRKLTKSSKEGD